MENLLFAAAVMGFFTFIMAGILFSWFKKRLQIERRVDSLLLGEGGIFRKEKSDSAELELSLKERVILPFWEKLRRRLSESMPQKIMGRWEKRVGDAGHPFGLSAADYLLGIAILSLAFFIGFFLLFMTGGFGKGLAMGLIGVGIVFFYSNLFLIDKRKQRLAVIERAMPDFFDMVNVSLEAGMGVDGAISKVCRRMEGPLSQEFLRAMEEMKLGKSRREAFSDLRTRIPSELFQSVMSALIQADQFGIGMTKVLRSQTRRIREQRRQSAREKAMKAPVKMLIPMVLFIFPTLFIVILGPIVVKAVTEWL